MPEKQFDSKVVTSWWLRQVWNSNRCPIQWVVRHLGISRLPGSMPSLVPDDAGVARCSARNAGTRAPGLLAGDMGLRSSPSNMMSKPQPQGQHCQRVKKALDIQIKLLEREGYEGFYIY